MANKDIMKPVDVGNPSSTRRSADLLPGYHRTEKNVRFLASTLDQYIQKPEIERVNGFLGSKLSPNYNPSSDQYIPGTSKLRTDYQLEPAMVVKDVDQNILHAVSYDDLINQIAYNGGNVQNLDRSFRPQSYSYNPHIDWDKFINFREYYWLPTGPDTIEILGQQKNTSSTYSVRDSADKSALIFTPDGGTTNPLLTLYRGLTYVFNVDSFYKFYVKTAYTDGPVNLYNKASNNGTKKGQVIVTIDENTPDTLFYFAEGSGTGVGRFVVKALSDDTFIDVETDVVGKKGYTSANGVTLSNGMKIRFAGSVTPESYANKEFFVEGVGDEIVLVDYDTLNTTGYSTTVEDPDFDATSFDKYPFDDFTFIPLTPDYITINRASIDKNPWSKYNRWVHQDVITATAKANGVTPVYPSDKRATRPIVEFIAGLQLFNFGSKAKTSINLIDNKTANAFKIVEGSPSFYIDGIKVDAGQRIIFNADTDALVRGKVFEVKIAIVNDLPVINLEEVLDSEPILYESVAVMQGTEYAGTSWWFNGDKWIFGQQKTSLNQAPLWELYDADGNRYADQNIYNSSFSGTKVFGYAVGTVTDDVLGFPVAYRNINNTGEYLFKNYYMTDTFSDFVNGSILTRNVSDGFLKINTESNTVFKTVWEETVSKPVPIIQYQVLAEDSVNIEINAINNPGYTKDLLVEVFVNDRKLVKNEEFVQSTDGPRAYITSVSTFSAGDRVLFKLYTKRIPNQNGYYEPPINLTNNPLNGPISDFTFSEISDHVKTIIESVPNFVGSFPGSSNLRDIANPSEYGSRLVTHKNPLSFAHYFLGTSDNNLIAAIRKVSDDYNLFKSNLLRKITELKGVYTPSQALDLALISLNANKDNTYNYNYSDMLAYGRNNTTRMFTVSDPRNVNYNLASIFDDSVLSERAVLVYLNGSLLTRGYDYTINKYDPAIVLKTTLKKGDVITVLDYPSTAGSYIPPTPTKLGLYPKFKPEIYVDNTYVTPTKVIQGHDGSITVAFNDYRDDIILEFEKRVYNNLKVEYNSELFDIASVRPGAFRTESYSVTEVNNIISADFLKWTGYYGVDYRTNNTLDELNSFTFNYTGTIDTLNKTDLTGYWRSIYKFFYDTDRPHTHPWEMLGFTEKPEWWVGIYGDAPYTRGNMILWEDLEAGRNAYTDTYNSLYARPGLTKIIPVDDNGNLLSPTDSGLASTPIVNLNDPKRLVVLRSEQIATGWQIGDQGPAETAWRRSSYWPFAVQVLMALAKPASYAANFFDPSRLKKNAAGEYKYGDTQDFISPYNVSLFGDIVDSERVLASGYSVLVIESGNARDTNYLSKLKSDLQNLNYQLLSKLGGFASKEKLQISIDAVDPTSAYVGALIPAEDFEVFFNKSTPIESIGVSGLIIQKTNRGWSVRGYDKYKPYFTIFKPFSSNIDQVERVGGISESYVNWSENTTYDVGQVVFYISKYYRVKQKHLTTAVFNSNYYQSLPYLPVVGGVGVFRKTSFDTAETLVPYGAEFYNVQDVYDLIVGYGKWLESKGFVFDEYNKDLDQILNWSFTAKEFLYWTTQNWAVNSVITLSPFANKIVFRSDHGIVDNISNAFQEYSLLKADGAPFPVRNFTVVRLDGEFSLTTFNTQEGLFFARINLVQKEHAIVLKNFTLFNDVIYDVETGYRQRRIKVKGFVTKNWNGDFFSPGFVFDQAEVCNWEKYTDYSIGDVVRFSGNYYAAVKTIPGSAEFDITKWALLNEKPTPQLLPNFEYKIGQFEDFYSLDIDNFDVGQQAAAQHLVGYTPRPYLNYIIGDPIAQYKFYQGFIREKGTKNPLVNLRKASQNNFRTSIDFNEEWAFRVGYYGGYNTYQELETSLEYTSFIENPQIIQFVNNKPVDGSSTIYFKDEADIIVKPSDLDINSVFKTIETTYSESILKLPVAGYVRFDDISATAFNKNSILDIANTAALTVGRTIWLGFREDGEWDVLRVTDVPTYISAVDIDVPGQSLMITTYYAHQMKAGDLISVTGVASTIDQCYVIQEVINPNQFIVLTTLTALPSFNGSVAGKLFAFKSSRLGTFNDLASVPFLDRWSVGEKVWVDNDGTGKWAVYEKIDNYSASVFDSEISLAGQHFGSKIVTDADGVVSIVASPDYYEVTGTGNIRVGRLFVSFRNSFGQYQVLNNYSLNESDNQYYHPGAGAATRFGQSMSFDPRVNLVIAGAPLTSGLKAVYPGTNIINEGGTTSTVKSAGIVKVSLLDNDYKEIPSTSTRVAISVAAPVSNQTFGWSVALSQHDLSSSKVYVLNTASVKVNSTVTGAYVSTGSVLPRVISIGENYVTLSSSQTINTATQINFAFTITGYTTATTSSVLTVSDVNGIVAGSVITGEYISGTNVTVTGFTSNNGLVLSIPQSLTTSSVLNIVSKTTGFTLGTKQKLFVGAPGATTSSIAGTVYSFDVVVTTSSNVSSSTVSVVASSSSTLALNPSYPLNAGSWFGYSISGNKTFTRLAVSAPYYAGTNTSFGAVFVYDFETTSSVVVPTVITGDDVTPPMSAEDVFGAKVEMSKDGQFLVVASPDSFDPAVGARTGVVDAFVWNATTRKFEHSQRISVPISAITSSTIFGVDISLNDAANNLVISSVGVARANRPTFDYYTSSTSVQYINDPQSPERSSKTTFDGGATMFSSSIQNAGTVHVYNRLGVGTTKWAHAQQLIDSNIVENSMFGSALFATDNTIFVGAPALLLDGVTNGANTGTGQVFAFDKVDTTVDSWQLLRYQEPSVDLTTIRRAVTIDTDAQQIQEYIDIIDPVKGKILGSCAEELRFMTPYDPAVYSIGIEGVNVDTNSNWLDEHVGELWWDLSAVKYVWYEQGNLEYRKNNWNNVFPGSSIDVYEWVRSEYLPAEWAQLADSAEGLTKGISGQPKFNDNSVISVKQVYNSVSNSFTNVYYYWVKNKSTVPAGARNRRKPAFEVAQQLADPTGSGAKFISILSPIAIALGNIKPTVSSDCVNLNISFDSIENSANRHTEWLLLQENDANSRPNWLLEKKLIDSLLGHDTLGNPVPDQALPDKLRYGVEVRPRQSLFVNRSEALRNIVEFANDVLAQELITGRVSFDNLNAVDELPSALTYDSIVEDIYTLELINTKAFVTAQLTAVLDDNGRISGVNIDNQGYGYLTPPTISIIGDGVDAELETVINSYGNITEVKVVNPGLGYTSISLVVRPYTAVVQTDIYSAGKWAVYEWNLDQKKWIKSRTQDYNTPIYWKYIDWVDSTFDPLKTLSSTIASTYSLEILNTLPVGSYVKVQNGGDGRFLILRKTDGTAGTFDQGWDLVYSEKGTIQILDGLWDVTKTLYAWDEQVGWDQTQYDQAPDSEILFILNALKDDIFIDDRKIYWNQLFFKAVRYAMSEQKFLDWAFKTTFISVIDSAGNLGQPSTYKLKNSQYYEDFLKEIKPYHTQIRKFTELYTSTELTRTFTTDFDSPSYYNTTTLNFSKVEFGNDKLLQYPWRSWFENYTYGVETIEIYDGGDGYTQNPLVTIVAADGDTGNGATAIAYVAAGKVARIVVTNPGKDYTTTPTVVITGGGNTSLTPARAYAQLGGSPVRSNLLKIKFDRVGTQRDIGEKEFTDTYIADGALATYPLTWVPVANKELISVKINGIEQLIDSYTILFTEETFKPQTNTEYIKKFATLQLTFVPQVNDVVSITYPKSLNLYTAAARILDYYQPNPGMPGVDLAQVMKGVEYSGVIIDGIRFDASGGWDALPFAATAWDNYGLEEGYTSYSTTATSTQTFVINSVVSTGTQLNVYIKGYGDTSPTGVRIDNINFNTRWVVQGLSSLTNAVSVITPPVIDLTPGDVVHFLGASTGNISTGTIYYVKNVLSSSTFTLSLSKFGSTVQLSSVNNPNLFMSIDTQNALMLPYIGKGTGAVDKTEVLVPGVGYNAEYTALAISAPNTLSGQNATGSLVFKAVEATVVSGGTQHRVGDILTASTLWGTSTFVVTRISTSTQAVAVTIVDGGRFVGKTPVTALDTTSNNTGTTATVLLKYGIADVVIGNRGSGYTEAPVITIIETINTGNQVSSVTIPAYARAVLRSEFTVGSSNVTTSTIEIPSAAFDTTSSLVIFRYSTSDGTVIPSDPDSLDALVDGGDIAYTTARGVTPTEIILDGGSTSTRHITGMMDDGFLNPINSYAPEECVPGQIQESIGISVYTIPSEKSPIIATKNYWVDAGLEQTTFKLPIKPTNTSSVVAVFNDGLTAQRMLSGEYSINFETNTVRFATPLSKGWLSLTSMQAGSVGLLDYVEATGTGTSTVLLSNADFSSIGSSFVTLNGSSLSTSSYSLANVDGLTEITVNSSGTVQAYLFSGTAKSVSEIKEDIVYVDANSIYSYYQLPTLPGNDGPFHSQVIVIEQTPDNRNGKRLKPPVTTYYRANGVDNVFAISESIVYPLGMISVGLLEIYVNGTRINSSRNWNYDQQSGKVTFRKNYLKNGDVVAIVVKYDYDYLIENGFLRLKSSVAYGRNFRVITFTNHDPDFIRSETFVANASNQYTMQRAILDSNYVWATYNGVPLIPNVDYVVDTNNRTVILREGIFQSTSHYVVITSFADLVPTVGYKIFQDMLGRTHYKRISGENTTILAQDLSLTDTIVVVEDASKLSVPQPEHNLPGVITVNGERIEFFTISGNVLGQLRRSTLGTAPKDVHIAGSVVFDQGASQTIPFSEGTQRYTTATTTSTAEFNLSGSITFDSRDYREFLFEDQVEVRYQGIQLMKPSLSTVSHNYDKAYDSTSTADSIVPPGFTINTLTNVLTLNTASVTLVEGAKLEVIRRVSKVWYDQEDMTLAFNGTMQAKFLADRPAIIPRFYSTSSYVAADLTLYVENGLPLTDENDNPIEGI